MLGLLESVTLESVRNLRIAFPLGLTAHGKVHTHLGAFAVEMVPETLKDLRIFDFTVADVVLTGPLWFSILVFYLHEFARGCLTLGATLRRVLSLIDKPAN